MGGVVRRYIHVDILIIIITFLTLLVLAIYFLAAASLLLCSLTLGAHVCSEGYCSCPVCMCVCVYVCMCVCAPTHMYLPPHTLESQKSYTVPTGS